MSNPDDLERSTGASARKTLLVTGGAGFIGSAVIRHALRDDSYNVVNVDKLTYAGNLRALEPVAARAGSRYAFVQADICDAAAMQRVFEQYRPSAVMHLAAESHVDRSISGPAGFVQTNIVGTCTLLEAAREYWAQLPLPDRGGFRFHHVSTDEVYGELEAGDALFRESTPYAPNSPYSASKAASDHLVRAWHRTYGLPVVLSNCSNNYGPYQHPEKLIPRIMTRALAGESLPIYGQGLQIRDWLYVEDHARALFSVLERGRTGDTYNIGSHAEMRNIDVVHLLCGLLEELAPDKPAGVNRYAELIEFVQERPGHDFRYAIDAGKIQRELGWVAKHSFASGLRHTVSWFLADRARVSGHVAAFADARLAAQPA